MKLTGPMLAAMKSALKTEIAERISLGKATVHYEKALQWVDAEYTRRKARTLRG